MEERIGISTSVPGTDRMSPLSGRNYLRLKRWLDVGLALFFLALFGPLMGLIALGIKLYSPGPVLFKQTRVGQNGKEFLFLKFRSMHVGSDAKLHRDHVTSLIRDNCNSINLSAQTLKLKNDPRITGLGRLLRKISFDELPQLFNVLRGEMSLVGPRPPIPYEVDLYQHWHHRRFEALPGLTGFWQVYGRNRVSFDQMVHMDIYYIEHLSLWLDLRIILKTPWAMFSGKGAG